MEKIKVFAVAPYEGMKTFIEQICDARKNIELIAITEVLEGITRIVDEILKANPDVIIARGLVADYLTANVTTIPTVKIEVSGYDILSAIRRAQEYNGKFAVVGFEEITYGAELVCNLLKYRTQIITVKEPKEFKQAIMNLKKEGYKIVVGGSLTASVAEKIDIGGIIVTSGPESIETALNQAVAIHNAYRQKTIEVEILKKAIDLDENKNIIFDKACKTVVYSNFDRMSEAINALKSVGNKFFKTKKVSAILDIEGEKFVINKNEIEVFSKEYIWINLRKEGFYKNNFKNNIKVFNYSDIKVSMPELVYSSSLYMKNCIKDAVECFNNNNFVIIKGDLGTEKDKVSRYIFKNSCRFNDFYISINIDKTDQKELSEFLEGINKDLFNDNATFYLKNIDKISKSYFSYIIRSFENRKCRVIVSVQEINENIKDLLYNSDENEGDIKVIRVPSLKERPKDIVNFFNIYIMRYNIKNAKKIIGLESDAVPVLEEYDWPGNLSQLKAVVKKASERSDSFYILKTVIEEIILESKKVFEEKKKRNISIDGTLKDITRKIVEEVLKEEDDNRTKTAERLNISRSKVWTILKDE